MSPVEDAERGRDGTRTDPWVDRVPCGRVGRVAGALLRRLGQRDAVSGALDSASFMHRLQRLLDRRRIADGAVLLFSLAEARTTLELLGPADHDAVLRHVAELMQAQSPRAPLGRVEEFAFAMVLDDVARAACVAAAVRAQIERLSVGLRARAYAAAAAAGVRLPVEDVLSMAVSVQAATGFTRAGPLLERCRERIGAAAADEAASAVRAPGPRRPL